MPIYEYEHDAAGGCAERFEAFQAMADRPFEKCPKCGAACHRVVSSFSVQGGGKAGLLSRSNLEAHGFSQFTRKGKGYYEKTAGAGPKAISDGR